MKTLYHVTPVFNVPSIADEGLSDEFSRGRTRELWFVEEKALKWALIHCSKKWSVPASDLAIYAIQVSEQSLPNYRHHGKGLYHCAGVWREYHLMGLEQCMLLVFGETV